MFVLESFDSCEKSAMVFLFSDLELFELMDLIIISRSRRFVRMLDCERVSLISCNSLLSLMEDSLDLTNTKILEVVEECAKNWFIEYNRIND